MRLALLSLLAATLVGCAPRATEKTTGTPKLAEATRETPAAAGFLQAALEREGRPAEDQARDAHRKPAEVLRFFGLKPGMRVGEMMAGSGYYTEIIAAAVGSEGHVYVHNTPKMMDDWARKPLTERLERAQLDNVTVIEGELADPKLPENLDMVTVIRGYHDFYWMGGDRAAFNRAVFASLKPGGVYGIVDHSAAAGAGSSATKTLHRVEQSLLVEEITAAGFELEAESKILHNPDDDLTVSVFEGDDKPQDRTHRFVLRFRKPADDES